MVRENHRDRRGPVRVYVTGGDRDTSDGPGGPGAKIGTESGLVVEGEGGGAVIGLSDRCSSSS